MGEKNISQRKRDQDGMSGVQYNHQALLHSRFNAFSDNVCICVMGWQKGGESGTNR